MEKIEKQYIFMRYECGARHWELVDFMLDCHEECDVFNNFCLKWGDIVDKKIINIEQMYYTESARTRMKNKMWTGIHDEMYKEFTDILNS